MNNNAAFQTYADRRGLSGSETEMPLLSQCVEHVVRYSRQVNEDIFTLLKQYQLCIRYQMADTLSNRDMEFLCHMWHTSLARPLSTEQHQFPHYIDVFLEVNGCFIWDSWNRKEKMSQDMDFPMTWSTEQAFKLLGSVNPLWAGWVRGYLEAQATINDGNVPQGLEDFSHISEALEPFWDCEETLISELLQIWTLPISLIVKACVHRRTIASAFDEIAMAFRLEIWDPLSHLSLHARTHLWEANISEVMDEIVREAESCLTQYPVQYLSFHLYTRFIVQVLAETPSERTDTVINILKNDLGLGLLMDENGIGLNPQSNFYPICHQRWELQAALGDREESWASWLARTWHDRLDAVTEIESDEPEWDPNSDDWDSALTPDEIEDRFEACGEPKEPRDYCIAHSGNGTVFTGDCHICGDDLASEAALQLRCTHTFHEGCIGMLINGIQKYSAKCPDCRYEICDRRERRPRR